MTRRAQSKLETRDKVLQAAKRLFISRGYEAATIRDIATEAGMSTGAVFANFTDKHDLFQAVLNADLEAHLSLLSDVANHPGPVDQAVARVFALGYAIHIDQLPLLQAATSLSWTSGLEGRCGERPASTTVVAILADMVQRAVDQGELKAQADPALVGEMLWDAYIANYRLALFDHWDVDQLNDRMAKQIKVVIDGLRV